MEELLLTNNPLVRDRYAPLLRVEYIDGSLEDVVMKARDCVHTGHRLLTHPLSGSVKPNQTPYKSILLAVGSGAVDFDSLRIIEGCLDTLRKMPSKPRALPPQVDGDYCEVDLTLIEGALASHGVQHRPGPSGR